MLLRYLLFLLNAYFEVSNFSKDFKFTTFMKDFI
ncbi:hypothetical protein cje96_01564 [Campylobacter jejuni subsp. jejuni LMG 23211]|nr:hypothetical protein cje96_01564 [Campylobacter jejuni subsp. jejuni LMG 23211]